MLFGGIVAIIDFLLRLAKYCNSLGQNVSVLAENHSSKKKKKCPSRESFPFGFVMIDDSDGYYTLCAYFTIKGELQGKITTNAFTFQCWTGEKPC